MNDDQQVVRYVIVVHGIGEQRKNETVLNVVNRFAEARHFDKETAANLKKNNVLTLGMATGQTGKELGEGACRFNVPENHFIPWLEFKGIPTNPDKQTPPFLGNPGESLNNVKFAGENLRFVDMCWSDIMQDDSAAVVQPPDVWSESVIGRLETKTISPPKWVTKVLELIKKTATLIHLWARFKAKDVDDTLFNKFLGDVQQYGEFSRTRGKAARRFHKLMARIEHKHNEEQDEREKQNLSRLEARYAIIAHSLGTIMSLDALIYAHVREDIRFSERNVYENLPFPGYLKNQELDHYKRFKELEKSNLENGENHLSASEEQEFNELNSKLYFRNTSWIQRVDSFVTLGSPIDKYLVLWWMNYKYLIEIDTQENTWVENDFYEFRKTPENRIKHYNYCEEQDPVGHNLAVVKTTGAYQHLFSSEEDIIYNRHVIPGAAHNEYWNDFDLFKRILSSSVDQKPQNEWHKVNWFDPKIYQKILSISYCYIPYLVIFFDFIAFIWAWHTESYFFTLIAMLAFVSVCALGRYLLDLSIWWRQILRKKSQPPKDSKENAAQSFCLKTCQKEQAQTFINQLFRFRYFFLISSILIFTIFMFLDFWIYPSELFFHYHAIERLLLIAVFSVGLVYISRSTIKIPPPPDGEGNDSKPPSLFQWMYDREEDKEGNRIWVNILKNDIRVIVLTAIGGVIGGILGWSISDIAFPMASVLENWSNLQNYFFLLTSLFVITAIIYGYWHDRFWYVKNHINNDNEIEIGDMGYKKYCEDIENS